MANSSPTLRELCRSGLNIPVEWLRGNPDAVTRVRWVTYTPEEIRSNCVILLPIRDSTNPTIIQSAKASGAIAVLFYGAKPKDISGLPEDLVVGFLEGVTHPQEIQEQLLTVLINHRVALMERGVKIHSQLSQIAAQGGGLEALAQAIGEITSRGIVIQNKRLEIHAEIASQAMLPYWGEILNYLTKIESLPELLRDRKKAGKYHSIFHQEIPGGVIRLVTPIIVGEIARGYLSLIGLETEIDALDHLVLEQGALVCAVEMARAKAVRETEKRLHSDLLTALLFDNISPRDTLLWLESMHIDPEQPYVAMRFAWDGPQPPSRRRMETQINSAIARLGLKTLISPMNQEVVCFCPTASSGKNVDAALALGRAVVNVDPQEFPGVVLRCGIGTPANGLSEWRRSFREAGQALEMAHRLDAVAPLYFPDLSIYRLLTQIEFSPELTTFHNEILGPLLDYEGGQELIHTLEAFFNHHGNLSQTADSLFIHRNTLNYRMERISEILQINLDNPESRLAVQLALHINRMLGTKRSKQP